MERLQHFQLSCAMARPFIAGDAVRVADEEELRSLVAGHADLCWSTACETMVGCHGIVAAVDEADQTVKLEQLVNTQDGFIRIEVTQWLPWDAISRASENLEELRAALEEAWMPLDVPASSKKMESEKDAAQKAADLAWTAKSGCDFPFDLVITSINGKEVRVPVVSLSDRLEQVRQTVAYHFGKVSKQIRLSINQEMLPETGTLERIADMLAVTQCLQVVIVKRQLASPVVKRLRKEERDFDATGFNFQLFSVPNPDVEPISDTMEAIIAGPAKSPYEGGTFRLRIQVPPDYPFRPPRVKFLTQIWIPSVHPQHGSIDLDILSDKWSPALSIAKVILSIVYMLQDPSDNACENQDALQQIQQHGMRQQGVLQQ